MAGRMRDLEPYFYGRMIDGAEYIVRTDDDERVPGFIEDDGVVVFAGPPVVIIDPRDYPHTVAYASAVAVSFKNAQTKENNR